MSLKILLAVAFGHLIVDMHQGAIPVLLPLLRAEYGLSYAMVAFLVVVSQLSSSVIQPVFGWLSDRVSTRWLLPASCLLAGGAFLILPAGSGYNAALLATFLVGLGVAGYHPEASKLAYYASGDRKAGAMSIFAIGGNVGMALGPLLMGLFVVHFGLHGVAGFLLFAVPAALLFWRLTPALYARVPVQPRRTTRAAEESKDKKGLISLIVLLIVIMIRSWTHTSMYTFLPLYYVSHLGMDTQVGSALVTVYLASGALGTVVGGWVADRWGRRETIVGSMLLSIPVMYLFPYTSGIWTFIVLALAGATLFLSFAVTTVFGQEILPHNVGLASGLTLGFSVGTGGIGATVLGVLADNWGIESAIPVIALMPLLGGLLALRLPSRPADLVHTAALPSPAESP